MRVPEGWKVKTISNILDKVSRPVEVEEKGLYREIGIRSHGKGIFYKEPISGVQLGNKRVFHIEPNCLVINIVFAWEQAVAKTTDAEIGMIASHRFPMFVPKNDECDIDFIHHLFKTKHGKYLLELASPGGAGRNKTLGQSEFAKLELLLPPTVEQQKIAQILSTWDKAITTTEQLLANSQQQKKALMQQLLTGKKRLLDEDGVRFSGEWLSKFLGDFCEISTGKSNREDSTSSSGMYTFFDRSQDIRTSNIFLFDTEAVIVAGEGQEFVPKYFSGKFDLHQRTYAIMGFANSWGKFIYFYLGHFNSFLLSQAVGSTVKSLRLPMFQKMPIKLPSLKEQQKIATVLTIADREIELLQTKLEALKQEKKALMQQLLTGKRRVVINH